MNRRTMVLSVEQGLSGKIHEVGLGLKTRGMAYRDRMQEAQGIMPKVGFAAGAVFNMVLFTMYRAYRGFFIILPAVFIEVRRKIETDEFAAIEVADDLDPKSGKLRLRSAILMNICAVLFTVVLIIRTAIAGVVASFSKKRPTRAEIVQ